MLDELWWVWLCRRTIKAAPQIYDLPHRDVVVSSSRHYETTELIPDCVTLWLIAGCKVSVSQYLLIQTPPSSSIYISLSLPLLTLHPFLTGDLWALSFRSTRVEALLCHVSCQYKLHCVQLCVWHMRMWPVALMWLCVWACVCMSICTCCSLNV